MCILLATKQTRSPAAFGCPTPPSLQPPPICPDTLGLKTTMSNPALALTIFVPNDAVSGQNPPPGASKGKYTKPRPHTADVYVHAA
jgi:hypothetical protein